MRTKKPKKGHAWSIGLAQFPKSHLISSHLIFAKVILLDLYEVTE